jgi:chromosome segregation ATPase
MHMLIGPTLTLEQLEQHMRTKIDDNKMELNKLSKEYAKAKQEFQITPKMIVDEEGKQIVNPRYLELVDEIKKIEARMDEIHDENDFLAYRIEELENIEERSSGKVKKDRDKITLTLNDCLKLGITFNKEEREEEK